MLIRLSIDVDLLDEIRGALGCPDTDNCQIVHEALALFLWAARQMQRGRAFVSANESGPHEVVTTPLLRPLLLL